MRNDQVQLTAMLLYRQVSAKKQPDFLSVLLFSVKIVYNDVGINMFGVVFMNFHEQLPNVLKIYLKMLPC